MTVLRYSLWLLLLALHGCALQPPAQFYQLQDGAPPLPAADQGPALLLGPLQLADYLQRENLLQRQADDSLSLSQEARWAGSLQDDVGQLLLRQLASRLQTSRIALYPDRVGFDNQLQAVLSISRLDSGASQPARLQAQWRLLDGQGQLRGSRLLSLQAEHDGTPRDQVRAQSELLQQLAAELAAAIRALPPSTPPPRPGKRAPAAKAGSGSAPAPLPPVLQTPGRISF